MYKVELRAAIDELEQHMLQEELRVSGYNQVQIARILELSRHELVKKLKQHGIPPRTHAAPPG
jgi:DNA-binding NtrC family response regulator